MASGNALFSVAFGIERLLLAFHLNFISID
jgi:hypothetical protein